MKLNTTSIEVCLMSTSTIKANGQKREDNLGNLRLQLINLQKTQEGKTAGIKYSC